VTGCQIIVINDYEGINTEILFIFVTLMSTIKPTKNVTFKSFCQILASIRNLGKQFSHI